MANGAFALLDRKMDHLGVGGHALILAVTGEAQRAPVFLEELLEGSAVRIVTIEAVPILKGAVLELFVAQGVVASLTDTGKLLLDDLVVVSYFVICMALLAGAGQFVLGVQIERLETFGGRPGCCRDQKDGVACGLCPGGQADGIEGWSQFDDLIEGPILGCNVERLLATGVLEL